MPTKLPYPDSILTSSLVVASCAFILVVVSTFDMFPAAQDINPCSKNKSYSLIIIKIQLLMF